MNSVAMSKAQLTVLLEALQAPAAMVSVGELPALTAVQYTETLAELLTDGVIDHRGGAFVPDRGLAQLMQPVFRAERLLLYCCRTAGEADFHATVYFARDGIAVLREDGHDGVTLLKVDSCDDLELLLPEVGIGAEQEISYALAGKSHTVTHRACFAANGTAEVRERRIVPGAGTEENAFSCSAGEYRELREEMIREVRRAVGG